MRRSGLRALVAAACLAGTMAVPTPAMASICDGRWFLGLVPNPQTIQPITIGAAGQPLVTTPQIKLWICTDSDGGIVPTLTPRVETYGSGDVPEGVLVYLESENSDFATFVSVIVGVSVDGSTQERIVTVPLPGGDGQDICVASVGRAPNPGGCLVFINQ